MQLFSDPATDAYVQAVGDTPNTGDFTTGTNTSNSSGGTTATCGAGSGAFALQPTNSGAAPLDLLGNRYVNLHGCDYYEASITDSFDSFQPNATNGGGLYAAQTNSSNTADGSVNCGAGGAVYPYQPQNSGLQALDTLFSRYVNIHQCTFTNAGAADHYTQIVPLVPNSGLYGYTTATNASDSADPAVTCGAGSAVTGYLPDATNSGCSGAGHARPGAWLDVRGVPGERAVAPARRRCTPRRPRDGCRDGV